MKRLSLLLLPVLILAVFAPNGPLLGVAAASGAHNIGATITQQAILGCYEPHNETPDGDGDEICPTNTPRPTRTPTATASASPTPTFILDTPTATGTATGTPVVTATETATGTPTEIGTATETATGTPTGIGTETATATATATPTGGTPGTGGALCPPPTSASAGSDLAVKIAGGQVGAFAVGTGGTTMQTFGGLQTGPLEVVSTNGQPLLPSQRAFYGKYSTFDELMGVPTSQLSDHYWFPWYDDKDMITWVLVSNPCDQDAHVTIKIAGNVVGSATVAPGTTWPAIFPGWQGGPVEVTSDLTVVSSERTVLGWPNNASSFNEVSGHPDSQLKNHYWFSSYNNADMIMWVLVANPSSTATAHVTISIAGNSMGTFDVNPGETIIPRFPGVSGGPVEVTSDINIITSERSLIGPASSWTFNEVNGVADSDLTTDYWFPWYDSVQTSMSILIMNPGASTAHATVTIAGSVAGTYTVDPGSTVSANFPGVQNGPVEVTSDVPVFTSEQAFGGSPNSTGSLNELLGLPASQLSTDYWFTWYDQLKMTTDLVVSRP